MSSLTLEAGIRDRRPPAQPKAANICWPPPADGAPGGNGSLRAAEPCLSSLPIHYAHRDGRMGLEFQVHRLPFTDLQALDPRLIRIPPGACNEKHRHAHESIFVVLEGEAEILVGTQWLRLNRGAIAHAPRWIVHQSRNPSADQELLLLAITDFGLTSAVLGDYDQETRLRHGGADAIAEAGVSAQVPCQCGRSTDLCM